jgi:alkylation response protein AidB-like acyl-CoA dehydrogenase
MRRSNVDEQREEITVDAKALLAGAGDRIDPYDLLAARYDRNLARISFPESHGGRGYHPSLDLYLEELFVAAGGIHPQDLNLVGYQMAAPLILAEGSPYQRDQFLRSTFTAECRWCQLFSEPNAGSDLASVSTLAIREEDVWRVTGQKVWTSMAHVADFGLLLAKTDKSPQSRRHHNLTFFIIDMNQPGVEVRPLMQMTGSAEFNEVFFSDARVMDVHRLGDVNEGWRVARRTLTNERNAGTGGRAFDLSPHLARMRDAFDLARRFRSGAGFDLLRHQYLDILMRQKVAMWLRERSAINSSGLGEAAAPALKVLYTELIADMTNLTIDLLGADGILQPGGYSFERSVEQLAIENDQQNFLRSRARTIGGGTSEILRNVIAEQSLGLPR